MKGGKMKTVLLVLTGVLLVAGGAGCGRSSEPSSPWARWGIASSTKGGNAEARLADAYRLLYATRFDTAKAVYRRLVDRFPQSAEAHLGLSMACRYLAERDTALAEARRAFALDSNAVGVLLDYGDLMLPMRTGPVSDLPDSVRNAEAERALLKAAASYHPFNAHAHIELWAAYMGQGRLSDARQQAFELDRKHYYHQPILDLAYNLLVGLPPNAILVTSGDNDTYPLWALQNSCEPFRPDVTVANLSLLNIPAVVKMMRDSFGLPVSLTDTQIDSLAPVPGPEGVLLPAQQVLDDVVARAARAGKPLYFAVTLRSEKVKAYEGRMVLEGLVNRIVDTATAPVDYDRIIANLKDNYRLAWPEPLPAWPENMSPLTRNVAPLAMNYANLYVLLVPYYDSLGRKDEAESARQQAATWLLRSGDQNAAREYIDAWLKTSPDDAEAKKLRSGLQQP
jgi:Tfp pilus assembly protein PilF